jgi:hypothetical protein
MLWLTVQCMFKEIHRPPKEKWNEDNWEWLTTNNFQRL